MFLHSDRNEYRKILQRLISNPVVKMLRFLEFSLREFFVCFCFYC
jgi:hypothetical protein